MGLKSIMCLQIRLRGKRLGKIFRARSPWAGRAGHWVATGWVPVVWLQPLMGGWMAGGDQWEEKEGKTEKYPDPHCHLLSEESLAVVGQG